MKTVKDKVVWITGAGSGIGKAIATLFGENNALIALSGRSAKPLTVVKNIILNNRGDAQLFCCDVSKEKDVLKTVCQIKNTYGTIDILINNAGTCIFNPLIDTTQEEWNHTIDTNLKGAFLTTRAVLPSMIKKKNGHIINMVSVAGIQPFSSCSAYCSSKYGLMGLTAVTREEARQHNIKVTAIIPGATDTPIWATVRGTADRTKMIDPSDIAQSVLSACRQSDTSLVEEITIRPISGNV